MTVWKQVEGKPMETRINKLIDDLTRHKEVEEQLHLQALALESAANGIIITDSKGVITWVNQAFTRLSGYSAEEAVGQSTRLLKSGKQDPSYYKTLWNTIISGNVWNGELINRRKDGSHYIEEMTITPVYNMNGELTHFISIKQDITARRTAEEKLHETLAQLKVQYDNAEHARSEMRGIFDATGEAMMLVSPDDRVMEVNRSFERFFSLSHKNVLYRPLDKVITDFERIFDDAEGLKKRLLQASRDTEQESTDLITQRWPQRRELELYSTPVRTAQGTYTGRLYVFRDVTHEHEIDRMKSEFVSLVSHELRTPLTSIIGYVDLFLEGDVGDVTDDQKEYLEIVHRSAVHLNTLIGDLLDVSRIEAGSVKPKIVPVDLAPLIHEVADLLGTNIDSKDQILDIELSKGIPTVSGDSDRINQILTNLISNANKYTPRGGTISITAVRDGGHVRIAVRDTGIGLTPEEQSKLFTKFYRVDNAMTREISGTGLGLWITRSLVEMLGGTIEVSSSPSTGSTFSFTLPVSEKTNHEIL
jgi:PAS domain S-box-containing protein